MSRSNKLIVVTASKGGVGKSTYAKLIANTVIQLKYDLVVADLDAQHADFASAFNSRDADSVSITEMSSFNREARLIMPEEPAEEVIETVVAALGEAAEGKVAIINTPSSALATIERFEDLLLPEGGNSDILPGTEVYLAYVLPPDDSGNVYGDGSPFLKLGPKRLITVIPKFRALSPEQQAARGATPDKTTIVNMQWLTGRVYRHYILEAPKANFRDATQMVNPMGKMVVHWWFSQVAEIAQAFNLSTPVEASNKPIVNEPDK